MMPNQHRVILFFRGFTLIELMIVIAVIGILSALAIPSYTDYIHKSRRADGISAILELQLAQEKWRANHTTYGAISDLWDTKTLSTDEHYKLSISDISATTFTIKADPQGGQTNDSCGFIELKTNQVDPDDGVIKAIQKIAQSGDDRCWQR